MQTSPWTNVYGLARSSLAVSTIIALSFTDATSLFRPRDQSNVQIISGQFSLARYNFFTLLGDGKLELMRWLAVALLWLVASGYRPRWTGLLHWWIATSFAMACVPVQGGDQIACVLTALLLPATCTDPRRWHWSPSPSVQTLGQRVCARIASSSLFVARLQVAFVYLWAGAEKMNVRVWAEGSAMYYWLTHPFIGLPEQYHSTVAAVLSNPWIVAPLTWSAILLELTLFLALTMHGRLRERLIPAAVLFHFAMVLFFGLVSFFFTMFGALILLLRTIDDELSWPRMAGWAERLRWRSSKPVGRPSDEAALARRVHG